jgi:2-C-methyl-D-erythritol 4-phosphate cytidylyltransferase / 2-C-methyl-D-erythritol 2,4-cyclodiphosphate synthase
LLKGLAFSRSERYARNMTFGNSTPASRPPDAWAIIVAAGRGERFGGIPKQFRNIGSTTVLERAVAAFQGDARFAGIIVVTSATDVEQTKALLGKSPQMKVVAGGATRFASVAAGVRSCPETAGTIFVHDAARPGLYPEVLDRLFEALARGPAAVPALGVVDSIRKSDEKRYLVETIDRTGVVAVQTPQAFDAETLQTLIASADSTDQARTDEASLALEKGIGVEWVAGDHRLLKITYQDDLERWLKMNSVGEVRAGTGFDVHRLVKGDGVRLCGVLIPSDMALEGHSDADVAFHALTDAILGCIGAGDIGMHFPPSDERWRGASSDTFLTHAIALLEGKGGRIGNIDLTIICERPKVGPHRETMRQRLAEVTRADVSRLSVKATTTEGLGFTGRGEGIAVQASVLAYF